MLAVLANRTYRHLFGAQVLSLLGSGLTTVALGLLAFDIAAADAGVVLGTAFAIKMIAYVGVAPVAAALAERLPRRAFLVGLDLARASLVVALPLRDGGLAGLRAGLCCSSPVRPPSPRRSRRPSPTSCRTSATTRARCRLSRLAYDLEALLSPLLAGLLLAFVSFHWLFVGNAVGFVLSAVMVLSVALPAARESGVRPFRERLTRGTWIYLATPRLRGLLTLSFALSCAGAMVIVNTVVIVKGAPADGGLGLDDASVALFFAAYGAGSMVVAFALPRLLDRTEPRPVMLAGGALLALVCGMPSAS